MSKRALSLIEILIAASLISLVFFMIFMSGSKVNREYYKNTEFIKDQDSEQNIILGLKPYFDCFSGFSWDAKKNRALIRSSIGTCEVFLLNKKLILKTKKGKRPLSKNEFSSFKMSNNGSIVKIILFSKGEKEYYFSIKQ